MAHGLSAPPVLSTPDTHMLSEVEPVPAALSSRARLSDEEVSIRYEIERTVSEIKQHQWKRLALQFPDQMLPDSARVYQLLSRRLGTTSKQRSHITDVNTEADQLEPLNVAADLDAPVKLTILGDTSYGSCCVDEIAAEHVDAEAVIHYGRACLSPTARLPVVYVFTNVTLDHEAVCQAFKELFPESDSKIIVTADTPYADHVGSVCSRLKEMQYENVFAASIVHDPSSLVPNRTVPESVRQDPTQLSDWHLFHISNPPTSLLLTLSSRMRSIQIYQTPSEGNDALEPYRPNTSMMLRRRYALITKLATVSAWGVLINTLSVKNYLHIVDHIRKQIEQAGKKSYLFVVGKLNPAKVANFAEIGGWVVVGCWESSLVDSKDFFQPIVTPFELEVVLAGDENRVWTGEWRGDFQGLLNTAESARIPHEPGGGQEFSMPGAFVDDGDDQEEHVHDFDSEEESAPPEFDLRTGRYVSHSRPVRQPLGVPNRTDKSTGDGSSAALTKRSNSNMLAVKGVASPAAEYLAQKRTWRGLGTDFEIKYEDDEEEGQGGLVEEGRSGVARGYTVGDHARS